MAMVVAAHCANPCPCTPGPSAGHGQPPQGTGGQEEEEEKEDEEAAEEDEDEEEEEEEVTLVTRRKRHPALGEGQAIASVIIYRTLAGLLPQQYDSDKRSLRCPRDWGAPGGCPWGARTREGIPGVLWGRGAQGGAPRVPWGDWEGCPWGGGR